MGEVFFESAATVSNRCADISMGKASMEVETPMMHPIAGGAVARPFKRIHNRSTWICLLRIAPNLIEAPGQWAGFDRVYEIPTATSATKAWDGDGIPSSPWPKRIRPTPIISASWRRRRHRFEQAVKDVTGGTTTKWGEHEIRLVAWELAADDDAGGHRPLLAGEGGREA